MKLVGMNWVWPMAPAHEPIMFGAETCPACEDLERGQELAAEDSPRDSRRGTSVASAWTVLMSPM